MKKFALLLLIGTTLVLAACSGLSASSAAQEIAMEAEALTYNPATIEVTAGKPVKLTFHNKDAVDHDFSIMERRLSHDGRYKMNTYNFWKTQYPSEWVTLKSTDGYPIQVWRRRMPQIDRNLLDCTIFLYPSVDNAQNGERAGGTGFLVAVPFEVKIGGVQRSHVYAVTNSHVIREGQSPVVRLNNMAGQKQAIPLSYEDWVDDFQGDDLAVCMIDDRTISTNYKVIMILAEHFLTQEQISNGDVDIGHDIVTMGRLIGRDGTQRNLPVTRFGNVSMLNWEPIEHPDRPGFMQESFLVECRSISGYSGSPVFLIQLASDSEAEVTEFFGIVWGHLYMPQKVRNEDGTFVSPSLKVAENTGMAMVIPAWRLLDALNRSDLVMARKKREKKALQEFEKKAGGAVTDVAAPEPGITKAEFEEALRKASRPTDSRPAGQSDSEKTET